MRRDFTVNSLFYNLRTSTVEDHTHRGFADLKSSTLSTPLPPLSTFHDDPLRCLRAVRFAARFDFAFGGGIREALSDAGVSEALATKVSRERVGIEIEGMLTGKAADPEAAWKILFETGLSSVVFASPAGPLFFREPGADEDSSTVEVPPDLDPSVLPRISSFFSSLSSSSFSPSPDFVRLVYLAAPLLPFSFLQFDEPNPKGTAVKRRSVAHWIIRDGLKLKSKDAAAVDLILAGGARRGAELMAMGEGGVGRKDGGLFVRQCKGLWRENLAVAAIAEADFAGFATVADQIEAHGLEDCDSMKPIVDGKTLLKALGVKNGPEVGEWMQRCVVWQLENPEGDRERCLDEMRGVKAARDREAAEAAGEFGGGGGKAAS